MFTNRPADHGPRILIYSVCNRCGAARVVSAYDETLSQWQREHRCEQADSNRR